VPELCQNLTVPDEISTSRPYDMGYAFTIFLSGSWTKALLTK
jgi:hypothetical protein